MVCCHLFPISLLFSIHLLLFTFISPNPFTSATNFMTVNTHKLRYNSFTKNITTKLQQHWWEWLEEQRLSEIDGRQLSKLWEIWVEVLNRRLIWHPWFDITFPCMLWLNQISMSKCRSCTRVNRPQSSYIEHYEFKCLKREQWVYYYHFQIKVWIECFSI